jgi:hypothetical protein
VTQDQCRNYVGKPEGYYTRLQEESLVQHKSHYEYSCSVSNLIQQYRITYNSNGLMFVVHREPDKPNMEFRMHESGLHYYDPHTRNND